MTYTHIIVGAGSAGCVLAEGLSRVPGNTVLLLEAGPDYTGDDLPRELRDGTTPAIGSHDWQLQARGPYGRRIPLPCGRVIGGTSQINSCIALRPEPADFAALAGARAPWWTWEEMLDRFKELEYDIDFIGGDHGSQGPLTIRRPVEESLTDSSRAFIEACRALGHPGVEDHNAPFTTGVGRAPLNLTPDGARISARLAYLDIARARGNLRVVSGATAERVVLAGDRARGVQYTLDDGARTEVAEGRCVVLAAGAYGTPAVLLRSGLGPHEMLRRAGIPVVVDLPGVGANLSDHSQVPIPFLHRRFGEISATPCVQALLRYTSSRSGHVPNDMQLCLINHVHLASYDPRLAAAWDSEVASSLTSNLMLPVTRGVVRLEPGLAGPRLAIDYGFTDDPVDLDRHREGVRQAVRILSLEPYAELVERIHRPADDVLADNAALDRWILDNVQPGHHPVGTARMGDADDPAAVVTRRLAVRGTGGLYVADASVLPEPIRANTNLTVMAVALTAVRLLTDGQR